MSSSKKGSLNSSQRSLGGNNLRDAGVVAVVGALAGLQIKHLQCGQFIHTLSSFSLHQNRFGDEGAAAVASMLTGAAGIETLV